MKWLDACSVGFFYLLFPHSLIQGAAGGWVLAEGQPWNLVVIGLKHYILVVVGNRNREVKRKKDFHVSKPTPPAQSCLSSSAPTCSP